MAFHDAYARITPFELAFPEIDEAGERLAGLREDAGERGRADVLADPGRFLALPSVAGLLREIRDPRAGADALQKHGILLFHAFHFEEAGRPFFLMSTHVARYLVESGPSPGEEDGAAGEGDGGEERGVELPAAAGYVQLPRHLFWIRPSEDGPPEPVDGIFWSAPDGQRIAALVAAGMRGDRPGLSVVPLPSVPLDEAPAWLDAEVRPESRDFESTLPGGQLERLYSFEAAGEVLKLLARFFRYVDRFPDGVGKEEGGLDPAPQPEAEGGGGAADAHDPPASGLPHRRVVLEG